LRDSGALVAGRLQVGLPDQKLCGLLASRVEFGYSQLCNR
jgi:hypothetical protein